MASCSCTGGGRREPLPVRARTDAASIAHGVGEPSLGVDKRIEHDGHGLRRDLGELLVKTASHRLTSQKRPSLPRVRPRSPSQFTGGRSSRRLSRGCLSNSPSEKPLETRHIAPSTPLFYKTPPALSLSLLPHRARRVAPTLHPSSVTARLFCSPSPARFTLPSLP
jgi:hypothetical protein